MPGGLAGAGWAWLQKGIWRMEWEWKACAGARGRGQAGALLGEAVGKDQVPKLEAGWATLRELGNPGRPRSLQGWGSPGATSCF